MDLIVLRNSAIESTCRVNYERIDLPDDDYVYKYDLSKRKIVANKKGKLYHGEQCIVEKYVSTFHVYKGYIYYMIKDVVYAYDIGKNTHRKLFGKVIMLEFDVNKFNIMFENFTFGYFVQGKDGDLINTVAKDMDCMVEISKNEIRHLKLKKIIRIDEDIYDDQIDEENIILLCANSIRIIRFS